MTRYRLLVASGDTRSLKTVAGDLARSGYQVARVGRLREAVQMMDSFEPDLAVVDYSLLEDEGGGVCRKLRAAGQDIPLLVLTTRDYAVDRLTGFRLGLDEYLAKPFSPAELELRVRAVLARRVVLDGLASRLLRDSLTYPDLQIDPRGRVVHVNKRKVELTNKEFDLLWALASKPNRVLSRLQLLSNVWNSTFPGDESTVTVHIHRLREKLEIDPANPRYIKTARGRGYKFEIAQ